MRALLTAAAVCIGFAASAVGESYPAVPSTVVTIIGDRGDRTTPAQYRAFQMPGDTFRILCTEPCPADPNTIYAFRAGFAEAKRRLVEFMGVDSRPEMQPFDIHIGNDPWCGDYRAGLTGEAGQYPAYSGLTSSFGCFWYASRDNYFQPFQPQYVSALPYHLLTVHEYAHTIFFVRHRASYEDIVKAASLYVSGINGSTITDPCAMNLAYVDQGKLMWALCRLNGFKYSQLADAMQRMDASSLAGQDLVPGFTQLTTVSAFKKALDTILGSETSDAFLTSKMPPNEIGADVTLTPEGGAVSAWSGWLTLSLPPGAIATTTPVHIESTYFGYMAPNIDWSGLYAFTPGPVALQKPATLVIKYDASRLPSGVDETTLSLYRLAGSTWQKIAGSRVDVAERTVAAAVDSLGAFGVFGAAAATATEVPVIIPVVGSARGVGGSSFKTALQLRNRSTRPISGKLIFHPEKTVGSSADPQIEYSIADWGSVSYADLLPAFGQSGLGTLDIIPTAGVAPEASVRVFNDGGASGTSGFTEESIKSGSALVAGDHAVLLAPANLDAQRLNVGVRALSHGAAMNLTVRNAAGDVVASAAKTYPPSYFEQVSAGEFTGTTLQSDSSIELTVTAGAAVVYGAASDNITNDPSAQFARSIELTSVQRAGTLYLPVVGSLHGQAGSFFKTGVQLHNPTNAPVAGVFVHHPAATGGSGMESSKPFTLGPRETRSYDDLPAAMNQSGLGTVDVLCETTTCPLVFARVYNDAGTKGTSGLSYEAKGPASALQVGDYAILAVPKDLTQQRVNVGIRTLSRDVVLTISVVGENSRYTKAPFVKHFKANWFNQMALSDFLDGASLTGGETVQIYVESGNAFVYTAPTDNTTNDPAIQFARALPFF